MTITAARLYVVYSLCSPNCRTLRHLGFALRYTHLCRQTEVRVIQTESHLNWSRCSKTVTDVPNRFEFKNAHSQTKQPCSGASNTRYPTYMHLHGHACIYVVSTKCMVRCPFMDFWTTMCSLLVPIGCISVRRPCSSIDSPNHKLVHTSARIGGAPWVLSTPLRTTDHWTQMTTSFKH